MQRPKVLAVIPARAGSKGLPGKNIRPLAGKPLIGWAIEAAKGSQVVDRIVVSTDGPEIAEVSRSMGAEVPFLRPAELALDTTPGAPPLIHALDWLAENQNYFPDLVLLLQPTSPLRTADDIDGAVELFLRQDANSVVGVTPSPRHPFWAKRLNALGQLEPLVKNEMNQMRRQDLPESFDVNGAIYLIKPKILKETQGWYPEKTFPYIMPNDRSIDIDSLTDFLIAESLLNRR